MAQKCQKGFSRVGKLCVNNKTKKRLGSMSDEYRVLKLAIIGAVSSVGGWAVFSGIVKVTNLDSFPWWAMMLFGFGIILLVYKFGLTRLK